MWAMAVLLLPLDKLNICQYNSAHASTFTYLLTYLLSYLLSNLLAYSMEQSRSWDANRFTTRQEIPRILWNAKVYYCVYKSPQGLCSIEWVSECVYVYVVCLVLILCILLLTQNLHLLNSVLINVNFTCFKMI